jgi:hypothetical protein
MSIFETILGTMFAIIGLILFWMARPALQKLANILVNSATAGEVMSEDWVAASEDYVAEKKAERETKLEEQLRKAHAGKTTTEIAKERKQTRDELDVLKQALKAKKKPTKE